MKRKRVEKGSSGQWRWKLRQALRSRLERLFLTTKHRFSSLLPASSPRSAKPADAPLAGKFCPAPFRQIDMYDNGKLYACCPTWLPTPMGNVNHAPVMELWNNLTMQRIRESIFDGSYRYCRHDRCPHIQAGTLLDTKAYEDNDELGEVVRQRRLTMESLPTFVNMCNDQSCNLYCPSCRTTRINHTEGSEYENIRKLQDLLLDPMLSEPSERHFTLSITGSGDPFASRAFRELLYTLDGRDFPNMRINLQTNGVLLTPRSWQRMKLIHRNIATIIISFDAASESTYAVTRRGGHWQQLQKNCENLSALRKNGEVRELRFDFVAQRDNYREMGDFVELAKSYSADAILFSRLMDWGTWPRQQYLARCVWEPENSQYADFMQAIVDPRLADPVVNLGNLSEYRALAMACKQTGNH